MKEVGIAVQVDEWLGVPVPGAVGGIKPDEQEKRSCVGLLQKVRGLVGNDVIYIAGAAGHPALVAKRARPEVVDRIGAADAEPAVEARRGRVFVTEVPFAAQTGPITGSLEEPGQRRQTCEPVAAVEAHGDVVVNAVLRGGQAGEERRARGGADGRWRKSVFHHNA